MKNTYENVYEIDGMVPVISDKAYIHDSAVVIGDVIIEEGVYIAPLVSLRGDLGRIVIKKNSNIQDNCVVHGHPSFDTIIGEEAHIGHCAVIHSCVLEQNVLIGINAVILDKAVVGENSVIGANSLLTYGTQIPKNSMAFGSPAKVVKQLQDKQIEHKNLGTRFYKELVIRSKNTMKKTQPLKQVQENRPRYQSPLIELWETSSYS